KNIVGDSAPQISIMQRLLFPNASRVCCWAHVWCNISAIINTFPKQFKNSFIEDLHSMQILNSKYLFVRSVELLEVKWSNFAAIRPILERFKAKYFRNINDS
ncbi:hypothetical protein ENBRE01_2988, partial [Enteropsectra breve]